MTDFTTVINEVQKEFGLTEIIKKIPDFINTIKYYIVENTVDKLSQEIINNARPEDKFRLEHFFNFLKRMWPLAPDILKNKIITIFYVNTLTKTNSFLISSILTAISLHGLKDPEFHKKMIENNVSHS